ncbi:MAG TPA: hypothetical protein VFJ84_02395 [Candidatus Saccharimonadales bacterium]|nr:hypothetical protein [Candidatus Saccharimonadales bacterium]
MSHHIGILPESYIEKLKGMSLKELAAEAALMRSDSRHRTGTATRRILQWARHSFDGETLKEFMKAYSAAVAAERQARTEGRSARPDDRPVKGGWSRFRGRRESSGFVASYS